MTSINGNQMQVRSERQVINLPFSRDSDWKTFLPKKLKVLKKGYLEIHCQDWVLNCRDLLYLKNFFENAGITITTIRSYISETIVSASALGFETDLILEKFTKSSSSLTKESANKNHPTGLSFHQGTLRSGEHLEVEGDVLLLGDVNPGAQISAAGNVMVWGRILGIAHAGKSGKTSAKISALQLRPVQLRIANKVARGPEEKPEEGLAEEALIVADKIVINPLKPCFQKT